MTADQTVAPPPPASPPGAAPRTETRTKPGRVVGWIASWDWRSHPPAWVVANLTSLLGLVTWIGHGLGLPATAALIVGGIGAAAAIGNAMIAEQGPAVIWWRLGCWIVPALWATAALIWSPRQPIVLAVGLGIALAAYLIASAIRTARRTAEQARAAKAGRGVGLTGPELQTAPADAVWNASEPAKTDPAAVAVNWESRVRRVCRIKGAQVERVGMWTQGTGYTVTLKLPLGGTSWKDIAACAEALAEDAGLPPDCGVTVKPAVERRGYAEVQVTHRNAMADDHLAPADYTPTSIYERATLGILPDAAVVAIAFKWVWAVISGQTDAGKTSLLHLVTYHFARCVDAVIWHIDVGGGGGLSRPWITPWHEGRAEHPVIDWAAATAEEAELMCDAAIAIIHGRKRHYAKHLDNGKLKVSAEVPQIEIMSDETATLPERVKSKLIQISQEGRGSAVRGVTGVLRATADDLPVALKKHARVRIGMRVSDRDEIGYLFDTPGRVDPELAPYRGSGWLERQDEDGDGKPVGRKFITPWKALFMPDRQIDEAAVALAVLRPALDDVSVALADGVSRTTRAYSDRWERTLPHLFADSEPAGPAEPIDHIRAARIAAAEADQQRRHAEGGSIGDRLAALNELGAKIANRADTPETESTTEVDLDTFAALTQGLNDNLGDVLAAVDAAGPAGTTPTQILNRVNAARPDAEQITIKTVQRKLSELTESGVVTKTGRGTYVATEHHTNQEGPTDDR